MTLLRFSRPVLIIILSWLEGRVHYIHWILIVDSYVFPTFRRFRWAAFSCVSYYRPSSLSQVYRKLSSGPESIFIITTKKKFPMWFWNMVSYINGGKLKIFENGMQMRIFGPKRDENGKWERFCNGELHSLYYLSNIIRLIKSRRLR